MGNIKLQKLKPMAIQKYYNYLMNEKGLSPNTVHKHHDVLNAALNAAVKQEYLYRNPMSGVERPKKVIHEANVYTAEQLQILFESVKGNRLETMVKIAAYLGLRREEICGLKWEDVDWDKRTLKVRRAMTQVGSEIVVKQTKTYTSNENYIFRMDYMPPLKKNWLSRDSSSALCVLPG